MKGKRLVILHPMQPALFILKSKNILHALATSLQYTVLSLALIPISLSVCSPIRRLMITFLFRLLPNTKYKCTGAKEQGIVAMRVVKSGSEAAFESPFTAPLAPASPRASLAS